MNVTRRILAPLALLASTGCYSGTEAPQPTEPGGGEPPAPTFPAEVSAVITGYVLPEPDVPLWYWSTSVRSFAADCASPLGVSKGDDVGAYNEKGGATYRAVVRLSETFPADGCVEVTLIYQPDYSNPAPPISRITYTVPVRFTVNGSAPNATIYRQDFHVRR